jgi:serine/threonine-protein kinase
LNDIDTVEGNCERLEQTSRQLLARDPDYHALYWYEAIAGYALGRPIETVRELLRQEVARAPAPLRPGFEVNNLTELDVLSGDLDAAQEHARGLEQRLAGSADSRWHAVAALWQVLASTEAGQPREAAGVAGEFLRTQGAWAPEARGDDTAMARDPTPVLLLAQRRAGLLSPDDFEARRREWVDAWAQRAQPGYLPFVWLHGYAAVAETAGDAQRALDEQPSFGPIPRYAPYTPGDAYIGTTYYLAGRMSEALPFLRRAARSCMALAWPFEHTRALLALGETQAALGLREEACSSYGVVLARWGNARPRSVTADKARALSRALGCRAPP